jgi:hypothetical protein
MAGFKFRRQAPVGPYIVDFVCLEARLVVEVDGGQHAGSELDRVRDAWLEARGFRMLRFWDGEVLGQTHDVLERIWHALHTNSPSPLRPALSIAEGGKGREGSEPTPAMVKTSHPDSLLLSSKEKVKSGDRS